MKGNSLSHATRLPPSLLREVGSYTTVQNGKPVTVRFDDGTALKDVADLYAIVQGEYKGTPSAESTALEAMTDKLQHGIQLGSMDWTILGNLLRKYGAQLASFRDSPDNATQGAIAPDDGQGRVVEAARLREDYATPSTTKLDKAGTSAHLLDSVLHDLAHTRQHISRILEPDVKKDPQSIAFNAEHALNHAESAHDHAQRLDKHLAANASDPKIHVQERDAINEMRARVTEGRRIMRELREAAGDPPPNLHDATDPAVRCGTCDMFDAGTSTCSGYQQVNGSDWSVQPGQVCRAWVVDPAAVPPDDTVAPMSEYSDDEPRDSAGKWSGGGSTVGPKLSKGQAKLLAKMLGTSIKGPDVQPQVAPGLHLPSLGGAKALPLAAAAREHPREDSGKFFATGSRVFDPLLVNADPLHATDAATRLVDGGRVRVLGQNDQAKAAAAAITAKVGDRASVRDLSVKGNPYTQLRATTEASTWPERLRALREAKLADPKEVAADPDHPELTKPTVAVDFDGTVHAGGHGMPGEVAGGPMDGAVDGLKQLAQRYRVVIFTARQDFAAVRAWLKKNGMDQYVDEVTNVKPAALAYIDDRAIHFDGNWPNAVKAADPATAVQQPIVVKKTFEANYLAPSVRRALAAA